MLFLIITVIFSLISFVFFDKGGQFLALLMFVVYILRQHTLFDKQQKRIDDLQNQIADTVRYKQSHVSDCVQDVEPADPLVKPPGNQDDKQAELAQAAAFEYSDKPQVEPDQQQPANSESAVDNQRVENDVQKTVPKVSSSPKSAASNGVNIPVFGAIKEWFLKGNPIVRVGMVILFIGVSFLINYTAQNYYISPVVRILSASALGLALIYVGWIKRNTHKIFAMSLLAGGIAILYLVTFAAFKLFALLPASMAFILLVLICAAVVKLALLLNVQYLAIYALIGALCAPIIVSTGTNNYTVLFSYLMLISATTSVVSYFKSWRLLTLLTFLGVVVISLAWGMDNYQSSIYLPIQCFAAIGFMIFLCASLLHLMKHSHLRSQHFDTTLLFSLPFVALFFQNQLTAHMNYGPSYSAFALSAIYAVCGLVLYKKYKEFKDVVDSYIAIALVLLAVAVAGALNELGTSIAWLLQGVVLSRFGLLKQRLFYALYGIILVALSVVKLFEVFYQSIYQPYTDHLYLIIFLAALCVLYVCYHIWKVERNKQNSSLPIYFGSMSIGASLIKLMRGFLAFLHIMFIMVVCILLTSSAFYYAEVFVFYKKELMLWLGISAVLFLAVSYLAKRLSWLQLSYSMFYYFAFMLLGLFLYYVESFYIGMDYFMLYAFGFFGVFIALYYMLNFFDQTADNVKRLKYSNSEPVGDSATQMSLVAHCILPVITAAWLIYQSDLYWENNIQFSPLWLLLILAILGSVVMYFYGNGNNGLLSLSSRYPQIYQVALPISLLAAILLATIMVNFRESGQLQEIAYIPILNPMDLMSLLVVGIMVYLIKQHSNKPFIKAVKTILPKHGLSGIASAIIFIAFTMQLMRVAHNYFDVDFTLKAWLNTPMLQMSLSLLWVMLGLSIVVFARRNRSRMKWYVGMSLLALVVLKLFLVDFSGSGTIARIVSFMVAGLGLTLVGYFAPIPPNAQNNKADNEKLDDEVNAPGDT